MKNKIPKNWKYTTLGEIANITNGKTNSQDAVVNGKYPLFDRSVVIKRSDKFLFDEEAIIVPGEGKEFFPKYFNGKFDLHQRTYAIFTNKDEIFIPFLYQYLFFNSDLFLKTAVGSTVKSLRLPLIKKVQVLLPPLPEQNKIAEILTSVDDEIQKVGEIILQTEKLKKGLMQDLLMKHQGLDQKYFSSLVKLSKDKIIPTDKHNYKYIGLEHIKQNMGVLIGIGNSNMTKSAKSIFKKGNVLFGKLRPYLKKYWKAQFDGVCSTEILVFTPILKSDIEFVFQLIQTDNFIQYVDSKSFGTKMPRTDWKTISEFTLNLPSVENRIKIGKILSSVDEKIEKYNTLKEALTKLKKGLIQDLLSGKVRVDIN